MAPKPWQLPSEYEVIYNGLQCWTAKNDIIFQIFCDAMFRYERSMEIVTAVQRGTQVYVYGQGQRQLCAIFAGNGPDDGLKGFTSSTVSVRRGRNIYVYDAQGRQISSVFAG